MRGNYKDTKYGPNYFNNHYKGGYESQSQNSVFQKKYFEAVALGFTKGRVLDIGCAYGYFLKPFSEAGFETYGVDISSYAINKARRLFPEANFKKCDINQEKLPFQSKHFDIVLQIHLLEHLENYYHALLESSRVLKKGGLLFIYVPTERRWYEDETHINVFTTKSLATILKRIGFEVVKIGEEGGKFQNLFGIVRLIKNKNTLFNFVPSNTGSFISCHAVKK